MSKHRAPVSTYRVQLNSDCRFSDVRKAIGYLHTLGISDLYLSPITKARPGSRHGYDVVDPSQVNSELGGIGDLEELLAETRRTGMGVLLDIVPNHMAVSGHNPYWTDFLENGYYSPYASYFDVTPTECDELRRITLPSLPARRERLVKNGRMTIELGPDGFALRHDGNAFPLCIRSYRLLLERSLEDLRLSKQQAGGLRRRMRALPPVFACPERDRDTVHAQAQQLKQDLVTSLRNSGLIQGTSVTPVSVNQGLLRRILDEQVYSLVYWKMANRVASYRRFFSINDLIGINIQDENVFHEVHSLILNLVKERKVQGLRIDHIDGLFDPEKYLGHLQANLYGSTDRRLYVVVEKILSGNETLPGSWAVSGTTGYEFARLLDNLCVNQAGMGALDETYRRFTGDAVLFKDVVYQKKKLVIVKLFAGEMSNLGGVLYKLATNEVAEKQGASKASFIRAISELSACLPVYRTYVRDNAVTSKDMEYISYALSEARRRSGGRLSAPLEFIEKMFTNLDKGHADWLEFIMRWQQFTGAIMAKGFEDTTLYYHNRLLSLNEVGGSPDSHGVSVAAFHAASVARQAEWPDTLNATTTHDTKRSEDVRCRIDVLSERPDLWSARLKKWSSWNRAFKKKVGHLYAPERGMEMHIYQTLLGAWPFLESDMPQFTERLKAYLVKAAREAKSFTNWESPRREYESALLAFADGVLSNRKFLADFKPFQEWVAYHGAINSLSQLLLKIASPGVPDFYQGTETWTLTLVDPDNRQPVDFASRESALRDIMRMEKGDRLALAEDLMTHWKDGRIKHYLMYRAMNFRCRHPGLFRRGEYIPLECRGELADSMCAFARRRGDQWAIIAVRLHSAATSEPADGEKLNVCPNSHVLLPPEAPQDWVEAFSGLKYASAHNKLIHHELFGHLPVALLTPDGGT